jgi:hypothetical protein
MTKKNELPYIKYTEDFDINPLIDPLPEIDLNLFQDMPESFFFRLGPENNYNPLIAYHFKKYGRSYDYGTFNAKERIKLNESYYYGIFQIRYGILNGQNLNWIITGLWELYKAFLKYEKPLYDLLNYRGIFQNCRWFSRCNEITSINRDVIFYGAGKNGWKEFLEPNETLRKRLITVFGKLADTKTEDIGALGFKNPLAEILQAKPDISDVQNNIGYDTFKNAWAYLEYLGIMKKTENQEKKTNQPYAEQEERKDESSKTVENTPQNRMEDKPEEKQKINERKLDGFSIPDWIDIKDYLFESKAIYSPAIYRIQGLANKLRGYNPNDEQHDCRKSIARIAKKYQAEKGEHLVHCDIKNKCYWIEEKAIALFKKQKGGRKKRMGLKT